MIENCFLIETRETSNKSTMPILLFEEEVAFLITDDGGKR